MANIVLILCVVFMLTGCSAVSKTLVTDTRPTLSFVNAPEGAYFYDVSGTNKFQITYVGGSGGNDIVVSFIPEPATLMLRALGRKAGEEKFIAALGAFAEEFSGRAAGPDDLLRTLSRETGADLASDWSRWVDQTGQ